MIKEFEFDVKKFHKEVNEVGLLEYFYGVTFSDGAKSKIMKYLDKMNSIGKLEEGLEIVREQLKVCKNMIIFDHEDR